MAPYRGKGGILHLSYLRNEFGDPNFFPVFTMGMFHKLHIWELSAHSQFPEKLLMNHLKINVIIGSP
jgi:hypothetical protein